MQSLPDPAREMHVRGGDGDYAAPLHDIHDALERVVRCFTLFLVLDQVPDFVPMRAEKLPGQLYVSRGIAVLDALACGTQMLVCLLRPRSPLPSALVVHDTALRAERRLRRFAASQIRIMVDFLQLAVAVPLCVRPRFLFSHAFSPFVITLRTHVPHEALRFKASSF
jgi:hypothetical protein